MADESSGRDERLEPARQALAESRQLQGEQKLREALAAVHRAEGVLDVLPDEPAIRGMRAAVYGEAALLMQRLGDSRAAMEKYGASEEAALGLDLDAEGGRARLQLATTLINVSGLLARERMIEEGLQKVDAALTQLRAVTGAASATSRLLMVGALQNRGALLMEDRQVDAAASAYQEAVNLGESLVTDGAAQLAPQLVEVAGRLTVVLRAAKRLDEALEVAERATRWAEAAYETGSPAGLRLYVATQMALVDIQFARGAFADAEDHLWKAIDTAKSAQTLVVGASFYLSLLRLEDAPLEEGGLPRGEVIDALDELYEKIYAASPPDDVWELLLARREVIRDRRADVGEEILERYAGEPVDGRSLQGQLLPLLRGDVACARGEVAGSEEKEGGAEEG